MNVGNIIQMLNQFKQNPMQILAQRGLNIPNNISRDPQSIVQYMLNNGQISQQQVNQAMEMAKRFNIR